MVELKGFDEIFGVGIKHPSHFMMRGPLPKFFASKPKHRFEESDDMKNWSPVSLEAKTTKRYVRGVLNS